MITRINYAALLSQFHHDHQKELEQNKNKQKKQDEKDFKSMLKKELEEQNGKSKINA